MAANLSSETRGLACAGLANPGKDELKSSVNSAPNETLRLERMTVLVHSNNQMNWTSVLNIAFEIECLTVIPEVLFGWENEATCSYQILPFQWAYPKQGQNLRTNLKPLVNYSWNVWERGLGSHEFIKFSVIDHVTKLVSNGATNHN